MDANKPGSRSYVPCNEQNVPELWEDEVINFQLAKCDISFNAEIGSQGTGTLYITSKRLLWIGESVDSAYDYDIAYIVLHAVSRDEQSYPKPCVYCQLDVEETGDEEDEEESSEVFLVPEHETDLMALFDALSHAALLNPDPEEEGDEFCGDFVYNTEEITMGAEQARVLDHLESVFQFPEDDEDYEEDGQYDDAEGDEEEEGGDMTNGEDKQAE